METPADLVALMALAGPVESGNIRFVHTAETERKRKAARAKRNAMRKTRKASRRRNR